MQLIKKAVQAEINEMSHEPIGVGRMGTPQINWQNVYYRLLEEVEEHIADDWPTDIVTYALDKVIEEAKGSAWGCDMLKDARTGWQEQARLKQDPYTELGISKHDFIQ